MPFGSLGGGSQSQNPNGAHSPFSASFGSSINSPSSFGPLSSAPFLQQSMPSFAPASSYNAAFEAANGGPASVGGPSSFGGLNSSPGINSPSGSLNNQALIPQSSNSNPINSYSPIPSYNSQHDSSAPIVGQQHQPQHVHPMNQQAGHSSGPFSGAQQHQASGNQYASQQYRPDMMSIAASAPVPSSNSYCK